MKTVSIRNRLVTVLQEGTASDALGAAARRWLEVDGKFTQWIHDTAKKKKSEDEMFALAEGEDEVERRVNTAWDGFVADKSELGRQSALLEALNAMTDFRSREMGHTD